MQRNQDSYGSGAAGQEAGAEDASVDMGGELKEGARTGKTEEGGQEGKAGGRKQGEGPLSDIPEERASDKLLDKETRKDEHEESAYDPESFNMNMVRNKNLDQPNGEIN